VQVHLTRSQPVPRVTRELVMLDQELFVGHWSKGQ
jgi:hypothetical protein